jgi:hypothetical protein
MKKGYRLSQFRGGSFSIAWYSEYFVNCYLCNLMVAGVMVFGLKGRMGCSCLTGFGGWGGFILESPATALSSAIHKPS